MSSIAATIAHTLESLMALIITFIVAVAIMGAFGGLSAIEMRLALLQAVLAFVIWARFSASATTD